ncbi:hypothetical protein HanIR_Chr14g0692051 [Helianthus annuus]|nr:hypothetical protein HanIR_Chr14g0692051 [Helianthus annuus]
MGASPHPSCSGDGVYTNPHPPSRPHRPNMDVCDGPKHVGPPLSSRRRSVTPSRHPRLLPSLRHHTVQPKLIYTWLLSVGADKCSEDALSISILYYCIMYINRVYHVRN